VAGGHGLEMGDEISLCSHARFCQAKGDVWHQLWSG